MDELISIIVPVYNLENYLERSIGSILLQSYQNLEVIAVDDGSSDHSYSMLTHMATEDARLRVLHQENQGVTRARLAGLSVAKGDWIGFVDGDDEIESDMFERLLRNAKTYNADISHCGYQMVFPTRVDYYGKTGEVLVEHQTSLRNLLDGYIEPALWNKLYRREIVRRVMEAGCMESCIRINEDLLLNYYLFREAETTVYEGFCPYHYMVRKGSAATSTLKVEAIRDPIRVREILFENSKEDPDLHSICIKNLAETLTRMASKSIRGLNDDVKESILEARKKLKVFLPQLRGASPSLRLKARWAVMSPETYRLVRNLYGEWTGNRHKYDI